jgi:hypothetical protein
MSSATLTNPSNGAPERTPLLSKSQSQSAIATDDLAALHGDGDEDSINSLESDGPKGREVEVYKPGKSTFTQTVSSSFYLIHSSCKTMPPSNITDR